MKIGDLVRSIHSPQFLGVILETLEDFYTEDLMVHWFDDNDWSWELCKDLELIDESR